MNITKEDLNKYRLAEITQMELCKKYKTYPKKLKKYLLGIGFNMKDVSNKKRSRPLTYNASIFNNVNSLSAYFLGYFLADGSVTFMVSKYKKKPILRFSCSEKDAEFFYRFLEIYDIKNKVNISKQYKVRNTEYTSSKMLSVSFSGEKCYDFICKYLDPINKTYKEHKMPKLSDDNLFHFLRGVFDGDGSVLYYVPKNRKNYNYSVIITSNSKIFLLDCINFLEKFSIKAYFAKDNSSFKFRINSKESLLIFFKELYKNSDIFMKRKYLKFLEIQKQINNNQDES